MVSRELARCDREGLKIVLADISWFEQTKGSRPYEIWRKNLALLSATPHHVVWAKCPKEIFNEEFTTGYRVQDLVDERATQTIRDVLAGLQRNSDEPLNDMLTALASGIDREKANFLQHDANKAAVVELRDGIVNRLREKMMLLRKKCIGLADLLADDEVSQWAFTVAKQLGCSDVTSRSLFCEPTLVHLWITAIAGLGAEWFSQGGLDSKPADQVTNDVADSEYIALSASCVSVVSEDKRFNRIYDAVRQSTPKRSLRFRDMALGLKPVPCS